MIIRKGSTVALPAYFETNSGIPLTTSELSLANCLFDINYTDGTTPSAGNVATRFLGDGWYAYDFTETLNKDFIYIARDSTSTYKNFPGGYVQVSDVEVVTNTKTHYNLTTEQVTITIGNAGYAMEVKSILLDLSELTQETTIYLITNTDGTNARKCYTQVWTTSDDPIVSLPLITTDATVAVKLKSSVLEGTDRTIYYKYSILML